MALATTQIHELMGRYEAAIYKLNDVYELHDRISLKPVRHENINGYGFDSLCHLLYMCQQIREWCEELPSEPALLLAHLDRNATAFAKYTSLREKIMRWLGWLQAKLHSEGLLSMEEAKRDLMPPGAEFSATGIMQQTMDKLAHAEACIKARDERIRRLEEELSMIGQVVRDSLKHVCVMANE